MPVPPAPVTVTVAVPPLQRIAVAVEEAVKAVGSEIVMVAEAVQELTSVTVTVYVPAASPVTELVPSPAGVPGVQSYDNVLVPPVAVTIAAPVVPP